MKHTHIVVALMALAAAAACSKKTVESTATAEPVAVQVDAAVKGTVTATITVPGVIAAAPGADWLITAPEAARIVELAKAEGDAVKEGDVLVRFEVPSLITDIAARKGEVAQTAARLQNARSASTRLAGLFERGIASQREVDEAKRELAEAEAAVAQARSAQESTAVLESRLVVRARFNGVVAKRMHNQGDMVEATASDPVMRIVDPSRIEALASVPVSDLGKVVAGRITKVMAPGAAAAFDGVVISRPPVVDVAIAAGDVRVSLPKGASAAALAVGTPVQIEIQTDLRKNVLVVSSGAIGREGDEIFVMVAGSDHKAHKKVVKVGLANRVLTEILDGVSEGDKVILLGTEPVPDGADIEIGG